MKYTVIRDSREQQGWFFSASKSCEGMTEKALPTGDYTLVGYELLLTIERKGSTGEFARNLLDKRFERELLRMERFKFAYVILEFNMADLMNFPKGSGIPVSKWPQIKTTPYFLLMKFLQLQLDHPNVQVIFAGNYGKDVASSIFKRVIERCPAVTPQTA